MKKTVEILNKINDAKNEMSILNKNGEVDKAMEKVAEIENLKKQFEIAKVEEEEILNKIPEDGITDKTSSQGRDKKDIVTVFNKALRGIQLDTVENAMIEQPGDANGGEYLVPFEQIQKINEIKKTLIPLKDKCEVIPVKLPKGSMPTMSATDDALKTSKEMSEISPSDILFGEIEYAVESYSDLIFVSNQFFNDTTYDITGIINKNFARKAVNAENAKIIEVLNKCTAIEGKTVKMINSALNTKLDPSIKTIAEIITDQDGFDYLDGLEDKIGRPLLKDSLAMPGSKEYDGKVITTMRNGSITKAPGTLVFYVGSVEEAVAFFDREEMTIALSNDFAFNKRAKTFLVDERFDVQPKDVNGVIKVTITPATTPTSAA